MSLNGLISGSECAVPSNPLSQVLKHTEGDRSLQQDRISGPSSSRLHHLPGTVTNGVSERDLASARQFFDGSVQGPSHAGPSFARPPQLPPAELMRMREATSSPAINEAWAVEHQRNGSPALNATHITAGWSTEFDAGAHISAPGQPTQMNALQRPEYQQQRPMYMGYNAQNAMPAFGSGIGNGYFHPQTASADQKGKGKTREIDFEAAFAQFLEPQAQSSTARIVELDDNDAAMETAMQNASLNTEDGQAELQSLLDEAKASENPPPKEELAKWEAEFNQLMSAQRDELDEDYGAAMQRAWENGLGDFDGRDLMEGENPLAFDDEGYPVLEQYKFDTTNAHLDPSSSASGCLSAAKAILDANGSLSEAALLLEAAIQKGDTGEGGYEAWILLGETRNMDDREDLGIRALIEGVRRSQATPGSKGAGMVSLAISYTNEGYERAAYSMLLNWLQASHPDQRVPEETITAVRKHSTWHSHEKVTELFISLAREQHGRSIVDPDLQVALGVLFYTNQEYEKAKDCFETALAARPRDYLLWNRLGSSLSNGNRPEEALGAYREALQLRPTYTRAIYNVGVACLNIGAHMEAAEHFLSALSLQDANGGVTSDHLWNTLRRVFQAMDRTELADLAKPDTHPPLEAFRAAGFDF